VDFLRKNRLCWDCSLYQKCSVDLKYAKKCVGPDPAGGAHDAPPDSLVGWGGGHPLPNPHSSRRLWRLDSRAFGWASSCPQCKILATPLSLFQTSEFNIAKSCQSYFSFNLPSAFLKNRAEKFDHITLRYITIVTWCTLAALVASRVALCLSDWSLLTPSNSSSSVTTDPSYRPWA